MVKNNIIHWGIIGCGDVTEIKSGPAFNLVEGSTLAAVMRRDAEKAKDYARRHNVQKWYSDADQLLNDPEINAVYIATPPVSHKEYAIKALAKGLHVYVEKPVAMNARETEEIAEAANHSPAKLSVAHYRRALPMFRFVKEMLDKNGVGDVRFVNMNLWQPQKPSSEKNWRINPKISGGGLFHDLSPHLLDLMLYYFGNPVRYQGYSVNQSRASSADDMVSGQIIFQNDLIFNGMWNFCAVESEARDECAIIGSKGSISFALFGKDVAVKTEKLEQHRTFDHPKHIQQPMIESVVKFFRGRGTNPSSIDNALTVMKIIDAFTSH
ncbi:MAG: Gfo/Idh/MocA family oxidoreductase [Bacteroidota bacterium]